MSVMKAKVPAVVATGIICLCLGAGAGALTIVGVEQRAGNLNRR